MTTTTIQIGGATITVAGDGTAPPMPQEVMRVTAFQAKAALLQAGLLDDVEAMMANPATPRFISLAWAETLHFERNSPTVAAMAAALSLDAAAVDALFEEAAGIYA